MTFVRIAILTLAIVSSGNAAHALEDDVSVRLRPLKGAVTVTGTDLKVGSEILIVRGRKGLDRLAFRFESKPGADVWIISDPQTLKMIATVPSRKIEIRGDGLRVDLRAAPSHIELVAAKRGGASDLNLVGFLSLEDYLEGVVPSEVPRNWPLEALKAQAVAARSFTLAKIRERAHTNPDWLLESNVTDQVFDFERNHAQTSNAVKLTEGEVLVGTDASVVAANYHSDCGGKTDEPQSIWGGGGKTGTAVDTGCAAAPRSSWRYVRSLPELTQKLATRGLLPAGFALASLTVNKRSPGGRALSVEVQSLDGRTKSVSGERLREALGYNDFKSTMFEVKTAATLAGNQLEFTGRGFGHGTGLCQWGSRQLAVSGKSYREILHHYYPLLTLSAVSRHRGVTLGAIASP